ncbi:PREDICTED: peptidyl-prolyl cis-trans isomerase FKBP8-like [Branchiostoma belcheri]|uniref:Peptidyl-prolyl cis-trans isomerase FKBP8-like n=1 Tax=Branchiostoma belcheri TaxID=7741 RepID=A0A6P4YBE0_BRABE|nr:PREDICTED: peptidyl-prolyl cis-trans isomerase FKBP8-like [Branchiostoma belcheri]
MEKERVEDLPPTLPTEEGLNQDTDIVGNVHNAFSKQSPLEEGTTTRSGKVLEEGQGDAVTENALNATSQTPADEPWDVGKEEEEDGKDADEETDPEWLDILGNGKLKKKVIVKGGDESTRPRPGQEVTIWSRGRLEDGTTVDQHDEITFGLQEGDVIQGIGYVELLLTV